MTINELKTGNIIINRNGDLGVVLMDEEYILYQERGMDWLSDFSKDLEHLENYDLDIMDVYETGCFTDYMDHRLLWKREYNWFRPSVEERKARREEAKRKLREYLEARRIAAEKARERTISVVTQQFYGNRTGTTIELDSVDYFLRGYLNRPLFKAEDIADVDRRMVHVPGAEEIVIVYDQTREDKYVNVDFPKEYARDAEWYREEIGEELTMRASCEIPEIGFKIHTRCFACRMDENGQLQSLQEGDSEKFIHYFSA